MQDKCCSTENELICPTCKNKIPDPLVIRCPRCFTLLMKTGCSGSCINCGSKKPGKTA
jgi:hypothetical protein